MGNCSGQDDKDRENVSIERPISCKIKRELDIKEFDNQGKSEISAKENLEKKLQVRKNGTKKYLEI